MMPSLSPLVTDNLRVRLTPRFQEKAFTKLIACHGCRKLADVLDISPAMIYHYRNLRVRSLSAPLFAKMCDLLPLSPAERRQHILHNYFLSSERNALLSRGRLFRRKQLQEYRTKIPSLPTLIKEGKIDVASWFSAYLKLIDFGCRSFKSVRKEGAILCLEYYCYTQSEKRLFNNKLPAELALDDDFLYFFGLWLGDKASGGRFGVVNKEARLNEETARLLRKYHQQPLTDLYIGEQAVLPAGVNVDRITRIKNKPPGWAIGVYVINSIFKRFFEYLEENLDVFLTIVPDSYIVFAGLFDAEGNVALEDRCVRWACRDINKQKIFKRHLMRLNLFDRNDGHGNLVSYNLAHFERLLLPHLKHPVKRNALSLLLYKQGALPARFHHLALLISENPGVTQRQLAEALKRARVSAQVKVLERLGIVRQEDYPKRIYLVKSWL
jgi:hypothetical protein